MSQPFLILKNDPLRFLSCCTLRLLLIIFVAACKDDGDPEKNRTVTFYNQSVERVAVSYIGFTADSTRPIADIPGAATSPLVRFKVEGLVIKPDTAVEIHKFSEETLQRSFRHKVGLVYYVLNIDSLEQIPWDTVRAKNRGVKIVYFNSYQKLQADSFRITYRGQL